MMKISKKLSVKISIVITLLFITALIFITSVAWNYMEIFFPNAEIEPHIAVILFTYAELIFAYVAAIMLLLLLLNIRKEIVFVSANVGYIRLISWMCFTEAILFFAEGIVYHNFITEAVGSALFLTVFLIIAFACAFMGIIVRVVKNIIEQATAIKNENDYTI